MHQLKYQEVSTRLVLQKTSYNSFRVSGFAKTILLFFYSSVYTRIVTLWKSLLPRDRVTFFISNTAFLESIWEIFGFFTEYPHQMPSLNTIVVIINRSAYEKSQFLWHQVQNSMTAATRNDATIVVCISMMQWQYSSYWVNNKLNDSNHFFNNVNRL